MFEEEREKLAENTSGEFCGEPNIPKPDLRERQQGDEMDEEGVGEYESFKEGPDGKLVEMEKEK